MLSSPAISLPLMGIRNVHGSDPDPPDFRDLTTPHGDQKPAIAVCSAATTNSCSLPLMGIRNTQGEPGHCRCLQHLTTPHGGQKLGPDGLMVVSSTGSLPLMGIRNLRTAPG